MSLECLNSRHLIPARTVFLVSPSSVPSHFLLLFSALDSTVWNGCSCKMTCRLRSACTPCKSPQTRGENAADTGDDTRKAPGSRLATIRNSRCLLKTSLGTERKPHNFRSELHGKKRAQTDRDRDRQRETDRDTQR